MQELNASYTVEDFAEQQQECAEECNQTLLDLRCVVDEWLVGAVDE